MAEDQHPKEEAIRKIASLIEGIDIAMFTTISENGRFHSRPMMTQQTEFDGVLWFFSNDHGPKTDELKRNAAVNLTYADGDKHRYVSLNGSAEVVHDRAKAAELWTPACKVWFPKGLDDPELALIKVTVEDAETWEAPGGKAQHFFGMAKALVTGATYDETENEKLRLEKTA